MLVSVLFTSVLLGACSNANEKPQLPMVPINQRSADVRYSALQKIADQNINKWIGDNIEEVRFLKECTWKVDDEIFFNTRKDRAYLLLLIQDNDTSAALDYVYVLYAAQNMSKWTIYFAGLPTFVIPRDRMPQVGKVAMGKLAEFGRQEIRKGYFGSNGQIDDKFVNATFSEELKARHLEFLRKR
ncbi:hypothetical protein CLV32_3988 [Pedobacter duraquae]|uniref:Uncharacterized protein n=2 Tax=Pedobacter duraquae TaxID=425511 RepID=A0A4R6IEY5_9SPHI|nr:hypothetical protein CLV32_3988 [Pedobacter duraquae]